jgi:hypothetical protein
VVRRGYRIEGEREICREDQIEEIALEEPAEVYG